MKKTIISSITVLMVALLCPQIIQAQGTIYLSSLSQTSTGSFSVGGDSWLSAAFETGNNTSGYALNSIQLGMTNASGNPSGFTVMLYSAIQNGEFSPESSLDTLNGSTNPATGGIFTYAPASSLILSSDTVYFIVLTAGTAIASGAYYNWSGASIGYNPIDGWKAPVGFTRPDNYQSSDGLHWNVIPYPYPQFAVTATAVPEPSSEILLGLGGLFFLWHRRKAKAV